MKRKIKAVIAVAAVVIASAGTWTEYGKYKINKYNLLKINIDVLAQSTNPEENNTNKFLSVKSEYQPKGEIVALDEKGDTISYYIEILLHIVFCEYPDPNATRECMYAGNNTHYEFKGSNGKFSCPMKNL